MIKFLVLELNFLSFKDNFNRIEFWNKKKHDNIIIWSLSNLKCNNFNISQKTSPTWERAI